MTEETPKPARKKRIILCSDGTWRASDMGDKSAPSNVAKLARMVANNGPDEHGEIVKQIVLYQSGLGSGDLPIQKYIYGALGWGLDIDVGDELFFFGFSRGAFTVRSVAGLVGDVGVLSAVHMSRFPEMWEQYRMNTDGKRFRESDWYRDNQKELGLTDDVRVKVVGVWDTVGALGIPEWRIVSWAKRFGLDINKKYAFHNTKLSKNVDYAFQALAIDENRPSFTPTLWHKTSDSPAKDLQQCWFPGVHSNIGGGQSASKLTFEEIGHITFAWMLDNLSSMLTFEDTAIKVLVDEHRRALNAIQTPDGWGCGALVDNFSGLRGYFWRILGKNNRTPGAYLQDPGDGTSGTTDEYFHPITRIRKDRLNYDPAPLQGYVPEKSSSAGWGWMKEGAPRIPEYVMHPNKKMQVAYEENGGVKYRLEDSLSRRLCPKSILLDLDGDNGILPGDARRP
ncbi:hypothetical protein B0I37DRAFT_413827 [Chaetomium sp. MPI-CAGE-AT-0009]|nr:hypothetical protein B0I37DRAFT_413827 [Chaetomium sp. MPI-CAGE-AT-0009]